MMPPKAEEIAALLEASARTLKSLSLRNILVLCSLAIIGTGVYSILYLLRTENRSLLVELTGRTRIIKTLDTCIVAKFYSGNNDLFAITRNYNNTESAGFYLVGILDKIPEKDSEIRKICTALENDVNVLKQGIAPAAVPSEKNVIEKTRDLLQGGGDNKP